MSGLDKATREILGLVRGSSGIETSVLSYGGTSILAGARQKLHSRMSTLSVRERRKTKGGLFLAHFF